MIHALALILLVSLLLAVGWLAIIGSEPPEERRDERS